MLLQGQVKACTATLTAILISKLTASTNRPLSNNIRSKERFAVEVH